MIIDIYNPISNDSNLDEINLIQSGFTYDLESIKNIQSDFILDESKIDLLYKKYELYLQTNDMLSIFGLGMHSDYLLSKYIYKNKATMNIGKPKFIGNNYYLSDDLISIEIFDSIDNDYISIINNTGLILNITNIIHDEKYLYKESAELSITFKFNVAGNIYVIPSNKLLKNRYKHV